ncbi:transposase [Burkholderia ubonensis]|uniref:IS6 family transposase n=1 Tax=Burkholderia ubonensis TaxID=101571 RepID=UPI000754D0A8|nr:IS6 family transposase [Burkholderia ubonensis]KVM10139.1 transposase [Burkholderia ubonensis]KVM12909.1 transposase [Burkholderia ubonensis]KVM49938.1 transposase [Burkholderia ubonensis]KVO30654.1 transposase [Burkholderia ubonensis]KVO44185.1 transposase [Burkholderia ubonensis]
MKKTKSLYHGHRFPSTVISHAVRWYFRFQLSLRDIEELLFERGVMVSYETIRRWCDKFGAGFAHRVKAARRKPGSTWHLDEMFVTLRGEPYLLWRAVDEHGVELDILLQKRRDKAAAKRFFKRVLRSNPVPRKIVTDQLRSYPVAKADIPELLNVKHVFVKAATRVNNRAENSHQPAWEHERRMRGFRDPKRTQAFLASFGPIRQHFAPKRHLLRASLYRKHLAGRFAAWRVFTYATQTPSNAF